MSEHESSGNYKSAWRKYKRNARWKGSRRRGDVLEQREPEKPQETPPKEQQDRA